MSLADSCLFLADRIPPIFTAKHYMGTSSCLWCSELRSLAWVETPLFSGETAAPEISLHSQLPPVRVGLAFSCLSLPSTPEIASSVNLL